MPLASPDDSLQESIDKTVSDPVDAVEDSTSDSGGSGTSVEDKSTEITSDPTDTTSGTSYSGSTSSGGSAYAGISDTTDSGGEDTQIAGDSPIGAGEFETNVDPDTGEVTQNISEGTESPVAATEDVVEGDDVTVVSVPGEDADMMPTGEDGPTIAQQVRNFVDQEGIPEDPDSLKDDVQVFLAEPGGDGMGTLLVTVLAGIVGAVTLYAIGGVID